MAVFLILILIVLTKEIGVTVSTGHCVGKVRTGSGAKSIRPVGLGLVIGLKRQKLERKVTLHLYS